MTEKQLEAEEQLRVLRSLMERSENYRKVAAPSAFIGGLCALAASACLLAQAGYIGAPRDHAAALTSRDFMLPWLLALSVTVAANALLLWRKARRESRPFLSAELRLALRSLLPSCFVAGAITFVAWRNPTDLNGPTVLGLSWIAFYGLALLATTHFAPPSLLRLGSSFVFTAVFWLLILSSPLLPDWDEIRGYIGASFALGLTFGVFHLVYAISLWLGGRRDQTISTAPN